MRKQSWSWKGLVNYKYWFLFGLMIYVPVNRFDHVGMASSSNHTIFLGKLALAVNQYFVYVLSLVTDNSHSWISGREENGHRIISWSISVKVWDRAGIKLWVCHFPIGTLGQVWYLIALHPYLLYFIQTPILHLTIWKCLHAYSSN